jgi:hypothetical protein
MARHAIETTLRLLVLTAMDALTPLNPNVIFLVGQRVSSPTISSSKPVMDAIRNVM